MFAQKKVTTDTMLIAHSVCMCVQEQETIHTMLAAVLHMTNVQFEGEDRARVASTAALGRVAALLRVDEAALEKALLKSINVTRGEVIVRNYTCSQAYDVRDALAKVSGFSFFSMLAAQV